MKTPKIFVKNNLDSKIRELLTKKVKYITPRKDISMLQMKAVKDNNKYYITYDLGEPKPNIETGSTIIIVQPDIKIETNWLKDLIKFSDAIHDYHGNARGTSIGPKDHEKNKGGISRIYLRHHLDTAEVVETIKDFYSLNADELELLKIRYK